MKGFVLQDSGIVSSDWIDLNGHMNIKAYFGLFEEGNWKFWHQLRETVPLEADLTMVAGRFYIEHRREIELGRKWELWSAILPHDAYGFVIVHRIRAADGMKETAATCEVLCSGFSLGSRARRQLPEQLIDTMGLQALAGYKPRLEKLLQPTPEPEKPSEWSVVVLTIAGKGNHAGLYIPNEGFADLSLAGARIVPLDHPQFPKGIPESFPIQVANPVEALSFLQRAGALCREIILQERANRGWHLTEDAPDHVLKLREVRSSDPRNMNCVEWIGHALDLGGGETIPLDVLTPEQLRQWCKTRRMESNANG